MIMNISQRFHNDTYAPGIATYGVNGKTGAQGTPGASMFFTNYSLPDDDAFTQFAQKITSRKLPLVTSDTILERRFVNGDTFVTPTGKIFKLFDIETLAQNVANGEALDSNDYIEHIGYLDGNEIPLGDTQIRKEALTITDNAADTTPGSALLTLRKTDKGNNNLDFICLDTLISNQPNVDFNIKFDKGYNGYMISSQYPIYINANVYVKHNDENPVQTTEYSPILTTNNSITDFVSTCRDLHYTTDASVYAYTKKIQVRFITDVYINWH